MCLLDGLLRRLLLLLLLILSMLSNPPANPSSVHHLVQNPLPIPDPTPVCSKSLFDVPFSRAVSFLAGTLMAETFFDMSDYNWNYRTCKEHFFLPLSFSLFLCQPLIFKFPLYISFSISQLAKNIFPLAVPICRYISCTTRSCEWDNRPKRLSNTAEMNIDPR